MYRNACKNLKTNKKTCAKKNISVMTVPDTILTKIKVTLFTSLQFLCLKKACTHTCLIHA